MSIQQLHPCEHLISVVQDLSLVRDLQGIMQIVARAARELSGADGASFVLRDGDLCYYAQENAISPLWQGRRFPMSACVSGWVMLNRMPAVIGDIALDPRVPADAYRPTFVRSMAMVPIRARAPLGALGAYWGSTREITAREVALLQALAGSATVALENVALQDGLEKGQAWAREIEAANRELAERHQAMEELQRQNEALSELLAHDLRSPAAGIMLAAQARLQRRDLPEPDRRRWSVVLSSAEVIQRTALNLLDVTSRQHRMFALRLAELDPASLFDCVAQILEPIAASRGQRIELRPCAPGCVVRADEDLLRRVLLNLVDNALRHSPAHGAVHLEARGLEPGWVEITVCDEGPGIPVHLRDYIFDKYARLADGGALSSTGRGLGLTFCRMAIEAHGGTIEVRDNEGRGSRFCMRLPAA
ncbi:ATP-binding protein [Sorangium sp. So ce1078]|uniref:GAF domain-containing sensor histidine kinase n=1 Tax=Sorangium sp. So ce1078 TaxID=3133329 RepID=UPI003F6483D7